MFYCTFRPTRYLRGLGLALLACGLVCGCAGKRAAVQGTVTFKGQPIDGGRIFFLPQGDPVGRPAANAIIKQGKYYLSSSEGPELGRHRVEIVWHQKPGKPGQTPAEPGLITDDMVQIIPAAYNSKTTLFVDVERGTNKFNFTLKERP
jgi:hypothetical protein